MVSHSYISKSGLWCVAVCCLFSLRVISPLGQMNPDLLVNLEHRLSPLLQISLEARPLHRLLAHPEEREIKRRTREKEGAGSHFQACVTMKWCTDVSEYWYTVYTQKYWCIFYNSKLFHESETKYGIYANKYTLFNRKKERRRRRRKLCSLVFLYFRPSLEYHPLQERPPGPLDQSHPSGLASQPQPSKKRERERDVVLYGKPWYVE